MCRGHANAYPRPDLPRDQQPRGDGSGDRDWVECTGRYTHPGAITLLVRVRVQSFLGHSIDQRGQRAAAVDQRNITEHADVDVVYS